MSERPPIKLRYNTGINAEVKDYLPIQNNVIPNIEHVLFDGTTGLTIAGTGATLAADGTWSYKTDSCPKVSVASGGTATLTYTPAADLNMLEFGQVSNDFADIVRTGEGGNEEDQLELVLLIKATTAQSYTVSLKAYSGTQTATSKYLAFVEGYLMPGWSKPSIKMNDTSFTYAGGFVDASWKAISKLDIIITMNEAGTSNYFYFGGLWSALPAVNNLCTPAQADRTNAYYPLLATNTVVYVSKIFGNDANTGQSRVLPVQTLGVAFTKLTSTRKNILILDSEIYKPIMPDYSDIGIKQTLNISGNEVTIYAEYLETPKISCKEGVSDAAKTGTRKRVVSNYLTYQLGSEANIWYVSKGGDNGTNSKGNIALPALTIGGALSDASAGDCIMVIDDEVYTENLTIDKNITIEGQSGKLPTLRGTITNATYTLTLDNIICKGTSSAGETFFTSAGTNYIRNITFTSWGADVSTESKILYIQGGTTAVTSCLFVDNGESLTAIDKQNGTAGTVIVIDNLAYTGNLETNKFFRNGATNGATASTSVVIHNTVVSNADTVRALFYYFNGAQATGTAGQNLVYMYSNDTTNPSFINTEDATHSANTYILNGNIMYNYFHDCYVSYPTGYGTAKYGTDVIVSAIDGFFIVKHPDMTNANTEASVCNMGLRINKNIFENITHADEGSKACITEVFKVWAGGGTINTDANKYMEFKENIFLSCTKAVYIFVGTKTEDAYGKNSVFNGGEGIHCVYGRHEYVSDHQYASIQIDGILSNLTVGLRGKITLASANAIVYNLTTSTIGDAAIGTTTRVGNPGISKFVRNTLVVNSIHPSSISNISEYTANYIINRKTFIAPAQTAGEILNFKFLEIEGTNAFAGITPVTGCSVTLKYCDVHDFMFGVKSVQYTDVQNSTFTYCGCAHRPEVPGNTASVFKNIIARYNYIAQTQKSFCLNDHLTLLENSYGIVDLLAGYYARDEYAETYSTMKNCIIFNNSAWDYYCRLKTTNCIVGTRYYDQLETSDLLYVVTKTETDFDYLNELDSLYLYPATKYMGYLQNSPAFKGGTDGLNIGARSRIVLASTFDYSEGTLIDNPIEVPLEVKPINQSSNFTTEGVYNSTQDTFAKILGLKWSEDSFGDEDQAELLENVFRTEWIILMSQDGGDTYLYYASMKDKSFTIKQYLYFDDSLPFVGEDIDLVEVPGFVLAGYVIDEIGG